ncbi:hypothetical protein HNR42_001415 [Deinobacterium chartae]|uniref:Uncharacterized protein n=1 Tax=Deinobacterium chartae TaxID=521158 RepID=A0A841I1P7_9DEIO|nr:hypothetical protein [Deinobacterium chartae]MBB6097992.1 hypothetical protein [Deinobacterium chartae]
MKPHPALLAPLTLGLLAACGTPAPQTPAQAAHIGETLILEGQISNWESGQTGQAVTGQNTATIDAQGRFRLEVKGSAGHALLPLAPVPDLKLLPVNCGLQELTSSAPLARVAVVTLEARSPGGSAPLLLGSEIPKVPLPGVTFNSQQWVYADQDVTLSGKGECTVTLEELPLPLRVTLKLNARLLQGWNSLRQEARASLTLLPQPAITLDAQLSSAHNEPGWTWKRVNFRDWLPQQP